MEHPDDQDFSPDETELDPAEAETPDDADASEPAAIDLEADDDFKLPAPRPETTGIVSTRDPLQLYLREISKFPMMAPASSTSSTRSLGPSP